MTLCFQPSLTVLAWKRLAVCILTVGFVLQGTCAGQSVIQTVPVDLTRQPPTPPPISQAAEPPRVQGWLPQELVLPPPSEAARLRASRFVEAEINPELPLALVVGRPKILRLADTPLRIYVPNEDVIQAEAIDQRSGRELAVTGLKAGTTTLMMWFTDKTEPRGESIVSYLVRVYEDPVLNRPLDEVERELNQRFPNSYVQLSEVNGR